VPLRRKIFVCNLYHIIGNIKEAGNWRPGNNYGGTGTEGPKNGRPTADNYNPASPNL